VVTGATQPVGKAIVAELAGMLRLLCNRFVFPYRYVYIPLKFVLIVSTETQFTIQSHAHANVYKLTAQHAYTPAPPYLMSLTPSLYSVPVPNIPTPKSLAIPSRPHLKKKPFR
jgi:hypothetical protein